MTSMMSCTFQPTANSFLVVHAVLEFFCSSTASVSDGTRGDHSSKHGQKMSEHNKRALVGRNCHFWQLRRPVQRRLPSPVVIHVRCFSRCSGYILTLPSVIVRNSSTPVCATFHNIQHDVTVTLTLRALRKDTTHTQQERFPRGEYGCNPPH